MEPEYSISTDPARLDRELIHRFLSEESYWAKGRSREVTERAIRGSFPFGVYLGDEQVGFARVVTDRATFAWLADVYIEAPHRGHGLGKRLVATVLDHRELQGLRRWLLGTADAHGLYRRYGFEVVDNSSGRFMALESGAAARQCAEG